LAAVDKSGSDFYYVDPDDDRDALRRRAMFNVVDLGSAWKIDFILRKNRAFSRGLTGGCGSSALLPC
jgi:hypothetical protein